MAFDKVIDSAKLNAGMTATADAIRGKTGGTDPIVWDENTGFKSAVEGISAGGGGDDMLAAIADASIVSLATDSITIIAARLCANCKNLVSVSLPKLISISSQYTFQSCQKLESINMPKLENITGMRSFSGCSSLKYLNFPSLIGLAAQNGFENCTQLECVDAGVQTTKNGSIGNGVFTNCSALKTLIFRNTSAIWTLNNVNSFSGTPFASGGTGGTVYCPAALIEQYQQATNWSTLYAAGTCAFLPIEGSEYE